VNAPASYQYRLKMNLEKSISDAIDLTRRLEAALEVDDMELCQDVLEIRGGAMATFESWHRTSSPDQIAQCRHLIKELVEADNNLQSQFKAAMEASAGDLRQLMSSGAAAPTGAYNTSTTQACVDRKA